MKQGIILIAHGSRDPQWTEPFERIASCLAERLPAVCVALAYLEHGPSLDEAVGALLGKGAGAIRVVPLFLGAGGHVKQDLPRLVAQNARAGVQLSLEQAIGEQPQVIEAIASAIAQAR